MKSVVESGILLNEIIQNAISTIYQNQADLLCPEYATANTMKIIQGVANMGSLQHMQKEEKGQPSLEPIPCNIDIHAGEKVSLINSPKLPLKIMEAGSKTKSRFTLTHRISGITLKRGIVNTSTISKESGVYKLLNKTKEDAEIDFLRQRIFERERARKEIQKKNTENSEITKKLKEKGKEKGEEKGEEKFFITDFKGNEIHVTPLRSQRLKPLHKHVKITINSRISIPHKKSNLYYFSIIRGI